MELNWLAVKLNNSVILKERKTRLQKLNKQD